jgi:hypothetical protein
VKVMRTPLFNLVTVFTVSVIASIFPTGASAAPKVPPGFEKLDVKQVCPASGLVSKYVLARAILKSHNIPIDMIDWNNTGIGEAQYVRAVSTVLCSSPSSATQRKLCFGDGPPVPGGGLPPSNDALSQQAMVQALNATLTPLVGPDGQHRDFDVNIGKATLTFVASSVAPSDERRKTATAPNAPAIEKVFSTDPKYFEIKCKLQDEKPSPAGPGQAGTPTAPSSSTATNNFFQQFRVRGKPEDLGVGRDDQPFQGVSAATLSTVNDVAAQKNTFDAHITVGYVLPPLERNGLVLESLPFIQYDRSYVDGGKAPPNASNVNNLGFGIQERFTFPIGGMYGSLFVQPEYIISLRSHAEVLKVRLAYEPDPLIPYIGFAAPTPVSSFWATAYARAVVNIYDVVRPSNDNSLAPAGTFVNAGTELGLALFVNDDDSPFNGISIPITYTILHGFSGPYKTVDLLQVAINYTLPKTKYVTVGLSYNVGRNLDTFEDQKVYKVSLGYKF